jgi:ABC-type transporter Mla MlaB component
VRPFSERNADVLLIGAITRAEIRAARERLRAIVDAGDTEVVACDVGAVTADVGAVHALARLQLTARRLGRRLQLRHASRELEELVAFCGLGDALPGELAGRHGGQAEQRAPDHRSTLFWRILWDNPARAMTANASEAMELGGLEPPTSWVRSRRSPN